MKNTPLELSGQAFVGEELTVRPVDIIIESGIITAIEENVRAPEVWICPAFFNAHTHLGDTVAMDCGTVGDLASLVTPPGGLKHRLLAEASRKDLVQGMHASMDGMIAGRYRRVCGFSRRGDCRSLCTPGCYRRPLLPAGYIRSQRRRKDGPGTGDQQYP